jgi:HEAT repeat protein
VLAAFGKEHFQMVTRGLSDHRWYVVRNVVGILGKMGNPKAIPYLRDTIKHEESRVRRETIRTLELIGSPEAAQVMLLALDDPSPRLRIKALNLLGKTGGRIALEPLSQILKSKHFKEKSEEEKKAILFSLAEMGTDEVVPALKKIAKKRTWFGREKDQETKILAIKALGLINTTQSQHALEELTRKGKKTLREVSKRILEKLGRRIVKEAQDHDN